MAHMIETAFYAKEPAWHGLGHVVAETQSSQDALKLAKLDWLVKPQPIYLKNGTEVPNTWANVRTSDSSILGVTSHRYRIVQNHEAFAFVDELLGSKKERVMFESAGSLAGGRRVWLLAHMPKRLILGDEVIPYLVFANSHDRSMAMTVALTPTRVVCQNTLTLAVKQAQRVMTIKHVGDLKRKKHDAAATLKLATSYMSGLEERAEEMQQRKVTKAMLSQIIEQVFPIDDEDTDRMKDNVSFLRNQFFDVFTSADDLKKFKGDAWGVYNGFADFVTHLTPVRETAKFKERHFASFIDGNKLLETAERAIMQAVA